MAIWQKFIIIFIFASCAGCATSEKTYAEWNECLIHRHENSKKWDC